MQTVTPGGPGRAVAPGAHGTWPFGRDRGPLGERAALESIQYAQSTGLDVFDAAQPYGFGVTATVLALDLSRSDPAETHHIMTAAIPVGGPTPEGMQ